MKKRRIAILLASLTVIGLLAAAAVRINATGTAAGTVISNQAYVDYQDANGDTMTRVYSNTVTTTVSQVAGVTFVPLSASNAGNNNQTVSYLVQVFNTGNGNDVYDLTIAPSGDWTPTSVVLYHDVDNSHSYTAGDTLMTPTAPNQYVTGTVVADDDYDIIMQVTIPTLGVAPDGSQSVLTMTATSHLTPPGTPASSTYTTTVSSAVVNAVKTHNTPLHTDPGTTVTYTITLSNAGSSNATGITVSDPLPAGVTYVPGSITVAGATKTDTADGDGADYSGTTAGAVTVTLASITAGGSAVVTFQVTVNTGLASGTTITNQANITFTSGANTIHTTSNGRTFFVATTSSVDLTSTAIALSGDPGDQIVYPMTVHNTGNANDTVDIAYTSSKGWTWAFWADMNGDGIPGNDGDYLLTDTDGDGKIDTGSIPQNNSVAILAVTTIPAGTSDGTSDSLSITGTSSNDVTKSDTQSFTTTVTAPVLTLSKSVSPTGNRPPGTTLTYTITATNTGTGVAKNVVITDAIPANTTYTAASIKTGQTSGGLSARTDANDGDGAYYDSASSAVIDGGSTLSIGPGGTEILEFKVTIN